MADPGLQDRFRGCLLGLGVQVRLSVRPAHLHPLRIEGARLLALAVSFASHMPQFERASFFGELVSACESAEYRGKIEEAAEVQAPAELARLGNRIEALH